ncbi:P2X purinoceptor 5 [Carlito syrichta]|uniref:P2X purinoceptor n=1 Tax=Carlito syrichta TaxID=1868482 RepID=A0A3Q0E585_CARSF|nr:P2X purinoceptor 5 [Carlito syrichta]
MKVTVTAARSNSISRVGNHSKRHWVSRRPHGAALRTPGASSQTRGRGGRSRGVAVSGEQEVRQARGPGLRRSAPPSSQRRLQDANNPPARPRETSLKAAVWLRPTCWPPSYRWVFLVKKSYQDVDTSLQSAVVTKVKGVDFTNTSDLGERLWDVADYVIPAQGENVFFVITNLIVTPNQRQDICAESENIPDGACSTDSDCHPGDAVIAGNGVKTGRCLKTENPARGTCEIFAWCPLETNSMPTEPFLKGAEDFTIYIKNFIRFPKFNFSKSNVRDIKDTSFLKSCLFGPKNHYCPIFRVGSVIRWAGSDFRDIAVQGGVIGIQIEWNCDLDKAASECNPHYSFSRLDNKLSNSVSGYNFRFAKYYRDAAGVEFRTLMKAYGIRFDVMVNGKGAFFCDLVLIYLIKKSEFYRDKKYEEVRGLEDSSQEAEDEAEGLGLSEQLTSGPGLLGLPDTQEQPKEQHGSGGQKGNGHVYPQLLEPSRPDSLQNAEVDVEQLHTLKMVKT